MPTKVLTTPAPVLRKLPSRGPALGTGTGLAQIEWMPWFRRAAAAPDVPADELRPRGWLPATLAPERLPWLRRPAEAPVAVVDEPRRPGWFPGETTAAAPVIEQMPWAHRAAPAEAAPAEEPKRRGWGPALATGTGLAQIEFMPWQVRRPDSPAAVAEDARRPGWFAGLTTAAAPVIEQLPWLHRPAAIDAVPADDAPRKPAAWLYGTAELLPWRRRPAPVAESPVEDVPRRAAAWLYGVLDTLPWRRRVQDASAPPAEDVRRPGWGPSLLTGTPAPPVELLPWRAVPREQPAAPADDPRRSAWWFPGLTPAVVPPPAPSGRTIPLSWSATTPALSWSFAAATLSWSAVAPTLQWSFTVAVANQPLTIYREEDAPVLCTATSVTGINGWTYRFRVWTQAAGFDGTPLVDSNIAGTGITFTVVDVNAGKFTMLLPNALTSTLPKGLYWYRLQRIDSGFNTVLTWGQLTIGERF